MFTGIIQGLGEIRSLQKNGPDCRITLQPLFELESIIDGESIAVNGVCLSVERHANGCFVAFASGETLSRTTLGCLRNGDRVNLERALAVGDRLGGHIVSGHVDCVAIVRTAARTGQSARFRVVFDRRYGQEVVSKGSVTLDGISLTVNDCGDDFLEVNIIPDTQKRTNMGTWRPGSRLNMETDIIGKYVLRLARPFLTDGEWDRNKETLLTNGLEHFYL